MVGRVLLAADDGWLDPFSESMLRDFVREKLAGYKVPKRVVFAASVGRSPSGKADYKGAKAKVKEALGLA